MLRTGPRRTDAELLRASGRDPEAFGELYDRHAAAVLAFFHRRTACAQTALDLTAETFAEAFAARSRYRDTGAPTLAWLLTIGRRKLARSLERGRVEQRALRRLGVDRTELDDDAYERLEELCSTAELRAQVEAAAASLSPRVADAVRLRVVLELPFAEVAERLGCSEIAARMRVARGLSQLHEALETP
ncbi:MAG TPA: RNA polymerase sigma factor [Solirubrobacteraceae bacterium]|jgi:RNA polymerase sigma-70 factor (ECF subfamily)|nr:RNA polymerase sigma factor [Solirubrobacteraceae bacterium]